MRGPACAVLIALALVTAVASPAAAANVTTPFFFRASRNDGGLLLMASASKGLYQPGEPVTIDVTLRNGTDRPQGLFLSTPCESGVYAAVSLPSGPVRLLQVGREHQGCDEMISHRELAPGEAIQASFIWRPEADARPGYYTFSASYLRTGSQDWIRSELFVRVGAFTDMAGHWALDTVSQAAETGVAAGYPDGSFHPDALIRRGEFFRWLATALDLHPTGSGEHWAVPWLNALVGAGLATDTGASLDDPVSRLEMASMVGQVVIAHGGPPPGNMLPLPSGDSVPPTLTRSVVAAYNTVLRGYPDGSLHLSQTSTRAEALTLVMRLRQFLGGS